MKPTLELIAQYIIAPLADAIRAGCQDIADALRQQQPTATGTPAPATPKRTRGANKETPPPAPEPATESDIASEPEPDLAGGPQEVEAAHEPKWTLEALKATFVAPVKDQEERKKIKALLQSKFGADSLAVLGTEHYNDFAEAMRAYNDGVEAAKADDV